MRTKFEDASSTIGSDLAHELEEDERERMKADRKSKSRSGMVYKSRTEQKRMERRGEEIFSSCLSNILADASIIDKLGAIRNLGSETIEILKEKRMSKARYYSISGAMNISGAIRRLKALAGSECIEIDLDTLESALKAEIEKNLPQGPRERALSQMRIDLSKLPERKAGVRWTVTINPRSRKRGMGLFE